MTTHPVMSWVEVARRINAGEDILAVLEERDLQDRAHFAAMLLALGGQEALDKHLAKMRDIDLGIIHARMVWHSISAAQRRALVDASTHGGRLDRVGKEYRHRDRHQPYRPIYVATVRNLCARELMAWDGGAFDPEAAAVLTERGTFILRHGVAAPTPQPPPPPTPA